MKTLDKTPDKTLDKPIIIPASRFLSDTIAAMLTANCYCQATLPGGAVMRYKPDAYWAIYRQGCLLYTSPSPRDS